jgi:hypothetical protein
MKDKGHFYISIIKSILRISGCIICIITNNIIPIAISFGIAEIFGIAEEIVDKR